MQEEGPGLQRQLVEKDARAYSSFISEPWSLSLFVNAASENNARTQQAVIMKGAVSVSITSQNRSGDLQLLVLGIVM